ncbi:MAG: gliding motility-associated C-terminal domain-containing protein [Bacteroidales bacterium]|nr:gliding motility-associated C-terminal domain-containing protein [Bacteroidales bacterium]MBN2817765.1 gliding motility-associated C-terminal domain-containing protein [Bacteroidales bacterium]
MKRKKNNTGNSFPKLFFIAATVLLNTMLAFNQVNAVIEADVTEGCTPLTVNFSNSGTQGDSIQYEWTFRTGDKSTLAADSYTFFDGGVYTVELIIENTNGVNDKDTATIEINAIQTPLADFLIYDVNVNQITTACANENIITALKYPQFAKDNMTIDFGDGSPIDNHVAPTKKHEYSANGTYTISITTGYQSCTHNAQKTITIAGPIADFTISKDSACLGEEISFTITEQTDVDSYTWKFGDNKDSANIATVNHSYSTHGNKIPKLEVIGSRTCTLIDTLYIYHVEAGIGYNEGTKFCDQKLILFQNYSYGNDYNSWDFGNGQTSSDIIPNNIQFDEGTYTVELTVSNTKGCSDTDTNTIVIKANPDIQLGNDWFACEGESVTLSASGGHTIFWTPSTGLDDPTSYTPVATPSSTVGYSATVTDTNTNCTSFGIIQVAVEPLPDWEVIFNQLRDTLIIGEIDTIRYSVNGNYLYSWSSDDTIKSYNSIYIVIQPMVSRNDYATYYLDLSDRRECFSHQESFQVYLREEYTFGLPKAFTPNGDGKNDIIKVDGWGIKNLLEFRVYNRWGKEMFFSDDINTGWDGKLDGNPQPIDSYAYTIKVELWNGATDEKSGTFSLIR